MKNMKRNLTTKERKDGLSVMLDLRKYCEKINAMMEVSIEGASPAIFKVILFHRMAEFSMKSYREIYPPKQIKAAEKIVDEYLKNFARIGVKSRGRKK